MTSNFNRRGRFGRLSRRDFVQFAAAAGSAAPLTGSLFASAARAAMPKKGGTFRLALAGANTQDSFDPGTWGTGVMMNLGMWGAVYNNLMEVAPDGKLVGELAQSVDSDKAAKVWTFKLRKGVTFSNGKALEASDVVASINHHRGASSKSAAKAITKPIVDIRADGKDVVVIELEQGNADFPYLCTDYHLVIGHAVDGKINWEKPVGTGGYVLDSEQRGLSMKLKRHPGYWKEGRANFDEVVLLGVSDSTARMNAIATGEVDAINNPELKTVALLARKPNVVIEEVTGTQHYTMPMFTDVAPFDDNNVRLALKHAIDRKALVKTILYGHGVPGNDSPITPANRYYDADIPLRHYDPDKARFYLKKAGLSSLKVDLSAADTAFQGAVDTALLYKEQAAKAGIDINVVREPNDGYWSKVWMKKSFVMCFWGGRPTEDWMFSLVYAKGAPWNDTHWNNETFNKLLLQARVELDEAKRRAMYGEMQRLVRDDGGAIVPMYANYVFARSTRIAHGEHIGQNWDLDGWKCIERWWMA